MDIKNYIEQCTKIEADQGSNNVEWSAVPTNEDVNLPRMKNLPYHLEIERGFHDSSSMKKFQENEHESDEDQGYDDRFQFAEIRSSVREMGLGWHTIIGLHKRYKESQQRHMEMIEDKSSSESDLSYFTANSTTNDSFSTAIEDSQHRTRRSSKTSVVSSADRDRYKKNALITGLLLSAESDVSEEDVPFHDSSTDQCDTSDLLDEKENQIENNNQEEMDDTSEKEMYQDRVFRLFQSKEDEDLYVHPLKEQVQEDPEWKEYRLLRKGIEYTETARHYYLNIPDEEFDIFERVEKKVESKVKRKVRKNRFLY